MRKKDSDTEAKENFEAFEKLLPQLLEEHRDAFALMRDKKIVGIYSTPGETWQVGRSRYADNLFSIHEITDSPLASGILSRIRSFLQRMNLVTSKKDRNMEVKENFEAFEEMLPQLLEKHRDKYALMRHQKVVGIYSTLEEVWHAGETRYKDGLFSVQEITDVPLDLGVLSHIRIPTYSLDIKPGEKGRSREIKQNYKTFEEMLPQLLEKHRDEFALMRHKKVVGIYSTPVEAWHAAETRYKDNLFSIQEITDVPLDLGSLSLACVPEDSLAGKTGEKGRDRDIKENTKAFEGMSPRLIEER